MVSLQPVVQSGIEYFMTLDGVAERNSVVLSGGTGIDFIKFFFGNDCETQYSHRCDYRNHCGHQRRSNAYVHRWQLSIQERHWYFGVFSGERGVKANAIVLSSTTAINLDCVQTRSRSGKQSNFRRSRGNRKYILGRYPHRKHLLRCDHLQPAPAPDLFCPLPLKGITHPAASVVVEIRLDCGLRLWAWSETRRPTGPKCS